MPAYTKKQIRAAYNISTTTLTKWLKRLNVYFNETKHDTFLNDTQIQKLFSTYGNPFLNTTVKPLV